MLYTYFAELRPLIRLLMALDSLNAMDVIQLISGLAYQFGLPGLFVASAIVNATVFIVVPVVELAVIALAAGQVYPPILLGVAAGLGAGVGEMTGYFVGAHGSKWIKQFDPRENQLMHRVQRTLTEHRAKGTIAIFVLASIPFPFDMVGLAAGLAKFPPIPFFIAAAAGKTVRFTVLAYAALWGFTTIVSVFLKGA